MPDAKTDTVSVYIMKSWPAPFRNNDMDASGLFNAVAIVSTTYGEELVRAFEGQSVGRVLFKLFETIQYWDENSTRAPVVVDKVTSQGQELQPYQVWNLLNQYCDRAMGDGSDKWNLKVHVDRFGQLWNARQMPMEAEASEGDEAWRHDPNLIPAKGDK